MQAACNLVRRLLVLFVLLVTVHCDKAQPTESITVTRIKTHLFKRGFPGNGALSRVYDSRPEGTRYAVLNSRYGTYNRVQTFYISGFSSFYIAFPTNADAYCFFVPSATATATSQWFIDYLPLVTREASLQTILNNFRAYVAESTSYFSSACGIRSTARTSYTTGTSSYIYTTQYLNTYTYPTYTSTRLSITYTSSSSYIAQGTSSVSQDPTGSIISQITAVVPQSALNDDKALCFLAGYSYSTPSWYNYLSSDAKSYLSSLESGSSANCATATSSPASASATTTAGAISTTTTGSVPSSDGANPSSAIVQPSSLFGRPVAQATAIGGGGAIPTTSPTATPPPTNSGGLSTGAKAGIGGGVAGGVVAIAAIGFLVAKVLGVGATASSGAAGASSAAAANSAPPPPNNPSSGGSPSGPTNSGPAPANNPMSTPGNPIPNNPAPPPMHQVSGPIVPPLIAAGGYRRDSDTRSQDRYSAPSPGGSNGYGGYSPSPALAPSHMYTPPPQGHGTPPQGYGTPPRQMSYQDSNSPQQPQWSPSASSSGLLYNQPGQVQGQDQSRPSMSSQYQYPSQQSFGSNNGGGLGYSQSLGRGGSYGNGGAYDPRYGARGGPASGANGTSQEIAGTPRYEMGPGGQLRQVQ